MCMIMSPLTLSHFWKEDIILPINGLVEDSIVWANIALSHYMTNIVEEVRDTC